MPRGDTCGSSPRRSGGAASGARWPIRPATTSPPPPMVAFGSASYTFSLQARNLHWWNRVRVSQPLLSLAFLVVLWRLRMLTLNTALVVLALTMCLQLGWAYYCCRSAGLAPGHTQARL